MKTPLRYPGGKSRVAEYLVSLFPEYRDYREPFLGGGSVFLEAIEKRPDVLYTVNDLYYDLYCFWKSMMESPKSTVTEVKRIKDMYTDGKVLYSKMMSDMSTDREYGKTIDVAAEFFVLNRITFSGTSLSGGYSDESFRKRFTESSVERLGEMGKFLEGKGNVSVCNLDFSVILDMEVYDPNLTFAFLDPPYYSAEDSALYGRNGDKHKGFDHERLKKCLDNCKYKWLMTYDDCGYIRNLYKDYNVREFEFSYGMRNAGGGNDMKGKELLISNYDISERKSVELF